MYSPLTSYYVEHFTQNKINSIVSRQINYVSHRKHEFYETFMRPQIAKKFENRTEIVTYKT